MVAVICKLCNILQLYKNFKKVLFTVKLYLRVCTSPDVWRYGIPCQKRVFNSAEGLDEVGWYILNPAEKTRGIH